MNASLRIDRLALRYRISTRHPAPALVQAELDRELADRLPSFCAAGLAATVSEGEGLMVIRRLDLKVGVLDGAGVGRRLGSLCARAIIRGVGRALAGELESDQVARYASRADYWACFIADLARGSATQRWQYACLDRHRTAPVGAAFETVREVGVPLSGVLGALSDGGRLGLVAAALTELEAAVVMDALETASGPVVPLRTAEVLDALAQPEAARLGPAALGLFAAGHLIARRDREPLGASELRVVASAAQVVVARRSLPGGTSASGPALRRRDPSTAAALATLELAAPELAQHIVGSPEPLVSRAPAPEGEVTPFGGIFLLLPALAAVDPRKRLPAAGRFLVLAKCLPMDARARCWYDPALCLAAGTETPPRLADLRALGAPPSPVRTWAGWAERVLHAFACRLPGFEESSPAYVMSNFVMGSAVYGMDSEGAWASLPRVPLRLVLRMSGCAQGEHLIPWLPGGRLRVGRDL